MARTPLNARRIRVVARTIHLVVAAALVGTVAAAPIIGSGLSSLLALAAGAPLLCATGLVMWRPALIARLLSPRPVATR